MITLTPHQNTALETLDRFRKGPPACAVLCGYAGSGKTTLIRLLVELLEAEDQDYVLLASTGRAARIVSRRTGRPANTVHGAIYKLNDVQVKSSHVQASFKVNPDNRKTNHLIIIDESSMLANQSQGDQLDLDVSFGSGYLVRDLLEWAGLLGLQPSNHVLFVGDAAQLPPVGESRSLALDAAGLEETFGVPCTAVTLTEIVRQQRESPILQQSAQLRERLETPDSGPIRWIPPSTDWRYLDSEREAIHYKATHLYGNQAILITRSNRRANILNEQVRRLLWQMPGAPIHPGEILLVTRNNTTYELYNGDLVKVAKVNPTSEIRRVVIRTRKGEVKEVTLTFRGVLLDFLLPTGQRRQQDCLILENALHSESSGITDDERNALWQDFFVRHPDIRDQKSKLVDLMANDPYINALHVKFGYALTCHKAQGGEWEVAMIDYPAGGMRSPDDLRWLYTAMTRGKQAVWFLNHPVRGL